MSLCAPARSVVRACGDFCSRLALFSRDQVSTLPITARATAHPATVRKSARLRAQHRRARTTSIVRQTHKSEELHGEGLPLHSFLFAASKTLLHHRRSIMTCGKSDHTIVVSTLPLAIAELACTIVQRRSVRWWIGVINGVTDYDDTWESQGSF